MTRNNVEVRQGPAGSRIARQETADHHVIVANSAGHGFVQRPVTVGNRQYVQRTYVVRGVPYTRAYRPYRYNGFEVNVYAPSRYYSRGFYLYAGTPWGSPFPTAGVGTHRHGLACTEAISPPYPVYAGPGLWLTDYLIASAFQDAYQSRIDASGGAPVAANNFAAAPMAPYVKQEIADEVQRQIALEQTESQQVLAGGAPSDNLPPILADGAAHTLIASSGLIVAAGSGECAITEGDVLRFNGPRAVNGFDAAVSVDWSKPGDCPIGSLVNVPVDQLQEMNNHMRETIDQGLGDLQTRQGQDGLPRVGNNLIGSTPAPFAAELPPPDPGVANQLRAEAQDAGAAWAEAGNGAPSAPADQPGTQSVALGQSIRDVESIMGPPTQSARVGEKTIYVYPSLKITFTGGQVSDVQ